MPVLPKPRPNLFLEGLESLGGLGKTAAGFLREDDPAMSAFDLAGPLGVASQAAKKAAAPFGAGLVRGARKLLSQKNVIDIAKELDTGRGGIARLVADKPALGDASRVVLKKQHGDTIALYRAISPIDAARPDKVVSLTTDPSVAMRIARDFPMLMGKNQFISPNPTLRRYDVPIDKIKAYIPALLDEAKKTQSGVLGKNITTRNGEKMSVKDIFEAVLNEEEVIADLEGLVPTKQMALDVGVGQKRRAHRALNVIEGGGRSGMDEVMEAKKHGHYFEEGDEAAATAFEAFTQEILDFIRKR